MKLALVLPLLFFTTLASANIPSFDFIAKRMAKTHGRGSYVITKDLSFYVGSSVVRVRETWNVSSSQRMHLKVRSTAESSEKISFDYFYLKGIRYFYKDGQLQKKDVSQNFYWPLFLTNSSRIVKDIMVKNKIIPSSALFAQPTAKELKDVKRDPPKFVSLSRVGGQISYLMSQTKSDQNGPSLWVTQDGFNISKLKLSSGARITPKKYKRFARNMWLPQSTSILFEDNSVQVAIKTVVPVKRSKVTQEALSKEVTLPKLGELEKFYETLR